MTEKKAKKPRSKPDRVKIDGDWENAVGQALKKPRPKSGWPSSNTKEEKTKK
jgi:hypothetical protein